MKLLSDRRKSIIELLQLDGRMSLSEIGRRLGITHVSVKKHLKSMLESDLVRVSAGLNPEKLGLKLLVIMGEAESYEKLQRLMKLFRECPRIIFLSTTVGAYNFMVVMVAESAYVVRTIALGMCCIRNKEGIRRSDVYVIEDLIYPSHVPLRIKTERNREVTPCGVHCGKCKYYMSGECLACPATKYYRGPL